MIEYILPPVAESMLSQINSVKRLFDFMISPIWIFQQSVCKIKGGPFSCPQESCSLVREKDI